jgi:hypothetical protein
MGTCHCEINVIRHAVKPGPVTLLHLTTTTSEIEHAQSPRALEIQRVFVYILIMI